MSETFESRMLIDGRLVDSKGGTYENEDPSTGRAAGQATNGTVDDARHAIDAARRAFDTTDWRRDHKFRRHCLEQFQSALKTRAPELRDIQVTEVGMTLATAGLAVDSVIENMDFMIGLSDSFQYEDHLATADVMGMRQARSIQREPYGVAGLISPWNAPFLTNIWKLTPALATGNTAVLKAAPATPWSATVLGEIIHSETDIPPGVVNILTSEDKADVGEALTGDPRVDLFHFTGSPAVGQRIMERAAQGLRHVALELGGKSANIVLEDADLDVAIPFSAFMCCMLSGQGCALPTRLLLPASLYDEGLSRVSAAFEAMVVGDPRNPSTVIGPIISDTQVHRIEGLVQQGVSEGAKVVTGGAVPTMSGDLFGGHWYQPTVLANVDAEGTVAQTEIFGPVLVVLRYESEDEAVRIANGTEYGLAAFVQSGDSERAMSIARLLNAGSVGINGTATWMSPDLPFGGYGISGVGREHGIEGFNEYLQTKAIASPA
jgi:aldehyde dehydrogenase (NAD+)